MILLALLGCPSPCPPGDPSGLEIGTGDREFEPVEDGAQVYPVFGLQGGYHYEVAVRAEGMKAGPGIVRLEMWLDGERIADSIYTDIKLKCDRDAHKVQVLDMRMFPLPPVDTSDTGYPAPIASGEIELRVVIEDSRGEELRGSTRWLLSGAN